jgi:hypothetical protein
MWPFKRRLENTFLIKKHRSAPSRSLKRSGATCLVKKNGVDAPNIGDGKLGLVAGFSNYLSATAAVSKMLILRCLALLPGAFFSKEENIELSSREELKISLIDCSLNLYWFLTTAFAQHVEFDNEWKYSATKIIPTRYFNALIFHICGKFSRYTLC